MKNWFRVALFEFNKDFHNFVELDLSFKFLNFNNLQNEPPGETWM